METACGFDMLKSVLLLRMHNGITKKKHSKHMKYSIMKQMNILEDIAGFKGWLNEPPWLLQFSTVKSTKNREQK